MSDTRPKSWHNWREKEAGAPPRYIFEHQLYSDSIMHGVARTFGPYELVNLIAGERRNETCRPALVLRITYHTAAKLEDTDLQLRGGTAEELACLISLLLAIRVRAADYNRVFHLDDDDAYGPLGRPCAPPPMTVPYLPHGSMTPVIARAERTADIEELGLLESFAALRSPHQATALVRAAR